jgi:hypothetical protein
LIRVAAAWTSAREIMGIPREGSASFCEQKEAKKLYERREVAAPQPNPVASGSKSFLLLFFKKEALAFAYPYVIRKIS